MIELDRVDGDEAVQALASAPVRTFERRTMFGGALVVTQWNDMHFRTYHTRVQLTEVNCEASELDNHGALCDLLSKLPGVERVFVTRYEIAIHIGEAWGWERVEPAILEIPTGSGAPVAGDGQRGNGEIPWLRSPTLWNGLRYPPTRRLPGTAGRLSYLAFLRSLTRNRPLTKRVSSSSPTPDRIIRALTSHSDSALPNRRCSGAGG